MKKLSVIILIFTASIQLNFAADVLKGKIQFASIEKATALLNTEDAYTNGWSQFDIDSRVQKSNSTKQDQFKNINEQIRAWTEEEKEKINARLVAIDKAITKKGYHLNLPNEIYLIKSTMKDEGGADGYTRANCIVLKDDVLSLTKEQLQDIIIHEVFHVLTRHDSIIRKDIYGIIGFHIINEVAYPENIKDYKISNPDAAKKDSYITIKKDEKDVDCMMILYSEKSYTSGSFFDYLSIGLLKLKGTSTKEVDYTDGKPTIYTFKDITGFFEQIGKNTPYIIDPEEVLAENFVFAINNKKGLPDQTIVNKIQALLKQ